MKIWISDSQTQTHRLIKIHCENHSNCVYVGDLDEIALREFFRSIEDKNVQKNIDLLKYYGYLNLFVIKNP